MHVTDVFISHTSPILCPAYIEHVCFLFLMVSKEIETDLVWKKKYHSVFVSASRQIVFINTSPPDERVELLKPINEIENMDDDCEGIYRPM